MTSCSDLTFTSRSTCRLVGALSMALYFFKTLEQIVRKLYDERGVFCIMDVL